MLRPELVTVLYRCFVVRQVAVNSHGHIKINKEGFYCTVSLTALSLFICKGSYKAFLCIFVSNYIFLYIQFTKMPLFKQTNKQTNKHTN